MNKPTVIVKKERDENSHNNNNNSNNISSNNSNVKSKNGSDGLLNNKDIQVKLEKSDNNKSVLRDKTNLNVNNNNINNGKDKKSLVKKGNVEEREKEKESKSDGSNSIKLKSNDKNKILEFMMEIPEINNYEINQKTKTSVNISSPFNDLDIKGSLKEKGNKKIIDKEKKLKENTSLQLRYSSDENSSFLSSPCVERNLKLKRDREGNDCRNDKELVKKIKLSTEKDEIDRDVSVNSMEATNGSNEEEEEIDDLNVDNENKRPQTPIKYIINDKPIYEYMKGEENDYYDIIGKKDKTEELDDNEKQFFEFVHYNFNQWSEQPENFAKEYKELMDELIIARIKYDKRIKLLRDNLDGFALNLEEFSNELNKRSKILKEYCEKIVEEIE